MPERKTLTKRALLARHYALAKGQTHILRKLVEESAEMTQVAMKVLDKVENKETIPEELSEALWEEMAHMFLFWGIAAETLRGEGYFDKHYNERFKRLTYKITDKMPNKTYIARVILDEPLQAPRPIQMPYEEIGDKVVCYLTPDQYSDQMNNPDALWAGAGGEPGWFDDAWYEEQFTEGHE